MTSVLVIPTSESAKVCLTHIYSQNPENATFLTDAERTWLLETIKHDSAGGSKQFKREFVFQALRDPKAYIFVSIFLL